MKKVLLSLAVVATVACFASCSKTCSCKAYVNGNVSEEWEVDLDDVNDDNVKKCSDLNTVIELGGLKAGTECKSSIF